VSRFWLALAVIIDLGVLAMVVWQPANTRLLVYRFEVSQEEDKELKEQLIDKGERVVPVLINRALDPDCQVRERVVLLLRQTGGEDARHEFVRALKDPRLERRECAEEALACLNHQ